MTSTPSDFLAASRFATRLSQKWLMSKEVAAADGNLLTLELICLVRRRGYGGFVTRRCLLREKRPRPVVVAVAVTSMPWFPLVVWFTCQQYARKGLGSRFGKVISSMVSRGAAPNDRILACAIMAAGKAGDVNGAVVCTVR